MGTPSRNGECPSLTTFEDRILAADRRLDGLPLERMTVNAGGRGLTIEAVRDQDRLLAAAGSLAPFPYGVLLWESAIAMADAVASLPAIDGARLLELGAGCGLAGLVGALNGARVVQTDHSLEALALCRRNARALDIAGVQLGLGDWTKWDDRGAFDIVIGADILYEPELYGDILGVLDVTCRPGGHVLLTDPGRTHAGRFVECLRAENWDVTVAPRGIAALPPCATGASVRVDLISARRD